jgi:hypothetical protein
MKKYFCVSFIVFFCAGLNAQKNTQKGLAALQAHNYGIAASYFQKDLSKAPIAASYGWALYYQTPLFYSADSAYHYLTNLEKQLQSCDSKARLKLQADFSFSDTTIAVLFTRLALQEFQATLNSSNLQDFEKFMQCYGQRFPNLQAEAVQKRDALAFELAVNAHTANALAEFLRNYPDSYQVEEAQKLLDQLLYDERTQNNSEEALASFIVAFPRSPYVAEAWSRIYAKYTQQQTTSSLYGFVQKYPNAPQADLAWKQVYKIYMQPYSVEKLAQFKIDYPTYPFLEDLASDGDLLLKKLYPFVQNGSFGYMDTQGKAIIAAQYNDASAFYDGLAIVSKDELFGLINKKNESITALQYLDISKSTDGFVAEDSTGYYIFNNQGQLLQKEALQWEELQQTLSALSNHIETVEPVIVSKYVRTDKNGKVGLNKLGKTILPIKYDDIIFSNDSGHIFAKLGKSLHYFDTLGKRFEFNGLEWFVNASELAVFSKEGVAVFSKASKLGLIDAKGKVLVKNTYDAAQAVYNGLWPVQQNGKWGLVSLDSKIVLPLTYEQILAFPPFGFLVESAEGIGLLANANNWLLNPTFKTIKRFETSYFLVENQEGLGLFNTDGSILIPCAYQRIVRLDDGALQLTNASGISYYLPIENKTVQFQP